MDALLYKRRLKSFFFFGKRFSASGKPRSCRIRRRGLNLNALFSFPVCPAYSSIALSDSGFFFPIRSSVFGSKHPREKRGGKSPKKLVFSFAFRKRKEKDFSGSRPLFGCQRSIEGFEKYSRATELIPYFRPAFRKRKKETASGNNREFPNPISFFDKRRYFLFRFPFPFSFFEGAFRSPKTVFENRKA